MASSTLMQDKIHPGTGCLTMLQLADVPFAKGQPAPLRAGDGLLDLNQIMPVPRGKIAQDDHGLIPYQERFQEIAADKSGRTCHQPHFGLHPKVIANGFKWAHAIAFTARSSATNGLIIRSRPSIC